MNFHPGDIAACYGADLLSRAISYGTFSPFAPSGLRVGPSHVAMICQSERHGTLWVESTTLAKSPCVVTEKLTRGVQAHYPTDRIEDYTRAGGRVEIYRLVPIDRLSSEESELLTSVLLKHFVGRNVTYDVGGAAIAGTRLIKRLRWLPGSLETVFCSELIAAVLQRLGRLGRSNPALYTPAGLVRRLVSDGTYQRVTA